MAGRTPLIPRTPFAALLALVLLLHGAALYWLAQQLEQRSALRAMATPMFTRLLQPEAPVAAPAPAPVPHVRATPRRPAISSVAKSTPKAPAKPASSPESSEAAPELQQPAPLAPSDTELAIGPPQPAPAGVAGTPGNAASTVAGSSPKESEAPLGPAAGVPPLAPASAAPATSPASSPASYAASPASPPASPQADQRTRLASWPADTRLSYELGGYFRGDLHGSARVQWQRQEDRYQTRVDIDLTLLASMTLTSQGEVTPQGLVPRIYEEQRRSGPRTARLGDSTITFNDGRTMPRPDGVQDTASQFVELSHRFATGQEKLEVGRSVSLWMARPGGLDLWTYDIVEREILKTPQLGEVEAYRLKPRPIANPRGNITAEIWFAPSLQYLPVRIRVHMGESTYVDLLVDKIEQR